MNLDRLASFLAALEEGSLTAAARRRHLSQPAVSLQIRALEEDLGVALLVRRGRGVRPTRAGEVLARAAREATSHLRTAAAEIAQLRGLARGTVRLGVTDAAATGVLPAAFAAFHRAHPAIDVTVAVHPTAVLAERLERGEIELAIGTLPLRRGTERIVVRPLVEEKMRLVVPRALAGRPVVEVLAAEPFMAYPAGSVTRALVDAALERAGLAVRPAMEIGRPDVMIRLVEAGLGVAVLPEDIAGPAERRGAVHRPPARRFHVVRALGLLLADRRPLEPAARAFAEVLRSHAAPRPTRGRPATPR